MRIKKYLPLLPILIGSVLSVFESSEASATIRYVAPGGHGSGLSWADATDDLQAAIDASQTGDEVWVAKGTYRPETLVNDKVSTSYSFILKDGVSLYGGFAGNETSRDERKVQSGGKPWDMENQTILSGDDDVPDVWERGIDPGTTYRYTWHLENNQVPGTEKNCTHVIYQDQVIRDHTVIDGFTITGGAANQHKVKTYGGGIYALGNVSINACRFIGNLAYFRNEPIVDGINAYGGAVYLNGAGEASVTNSYFAKNYANSSYTLGRGGALFVQNAKVDSCLFEECVGEDGGGAVFQLGGTLSNCTFRDCYGSSGGALLTTGNVESVMVENCRALLGGGIYGDAGALISHATVAGCYADALEFGDSMGGSAGGVFLMGGNIVGSLVFNNTSFRGGGIMVRQEGKVVNCTVLNNSIRATDISDTNFALWDTETTVDGYLYNTISAPDTELSNFVAPTSYAGIPENDAQQAEIQTADWSLVAGSPFIDSGTVTPGFAETTDIYGNPRMSGSSIDCGACEYTSSEVYPNAVLTFDGSKETVDIGFRVSSGSILIKVADKEYNLQVNNSDKVVEVPLEGQYTVELYSTGLQRLNIDNQGLYALDVANAPELTLMQLYDNSLTALDIAANPKLTGIYADNNNISKLDVTGNPALRVINMPGNNLQGTVDLSHLSGLSSVNFDGNSISGLILPKEAPVVDISVERNSISVIDVENMSHLRSLNVCDNELTSLSLAGCGTLEDLYATGNKITSVTGIADCQVMETLNVSYNELVSIDLTGATGLTGLYLQHNRLQSLDITPCPALSWINVTSNEIPVLDISRLSNLRLLHANDNRIAEIDLSSAAYCSQVTLGNNLLTEIDVTGLPMLYWLRVDGNNLSELDVTANKSLSLLECGNNNLAELDITENSALRRLAAEYNKLESLDVSANPELCGLQINNNNMDAEAINEIIDALPSIVGQVPLPGSEWISMLDISYMPGTADADVETAREKGWNVTAACGDNVAETGIGDVEVKTVTYYLTDGTCMGTIMPDNCIVIERKVMGDGSVKIIKRLANKQK